jgi:membrane protease YdiL (CAAX protease family)
MIWTYWLFLAGVSVLTTFIGYGTYRTAQLLKTWRPETNILLHPLENAGRVGLILLCLGLGKLSGLDAASLGWQIADWEQQLILGAMIGLGLGAIFYYLTHWLKTQTDQKIYSSVILDLIAPQTFTELLLVLFWMGPVVLLEELLFRSLLLGGLAPLLPLPLLLLGLGLLFGLMHSPQGMWGMVGASLAGLILGLLFWWQHSLILPLTTHYLINAWQIIQVWRQPPPILNAA